MNFLLASGKTLPHWYTAKNFTELSYDVKILIHLKISSNNIIT